MQKPMAGGGGYDQMYHFKARPIRSSIDNPDTLRAATVLLLDGCSSRQNGEYRFLGLQRKGLGQTIHVVLNSYERYRNCLCLEGVAFLQLRCCRRFMCRRLRGGRTCGHCSKGKDRQGCKQNFVSHCYFFG